MKPSLAVMLLPGPRRGRGDQTSANRLMQGAWGVISLPSASLADRFSPLATPRFMLDALSTISVNRPGPTLMPCAELVAALPSRQTVKMLRNATFLGFRQQSLEPGFRRKRLLSLRIALEVFRHCASVKTYPLRG